MSVLHYKLDIDVDDSFKILNTKTLITDEAKVMTEFNDRRQRVYRRVRERFSDACVKQVYLLGTASTMV